MTDIDPNELFIGHRLDDAGAQPHPVTGGVGQAAVNDLNLAALVGQP